MILLAAAIYVYRQIFAPLNPVDTVYIYIDEEKDYEDVILQLKENDALPSEKIFRLLAEKMNYPERVKSGRYGISAGMTMPDVIRILRSGNQSPVNITFNNIRTREDLAGRLAGQLMIDSLSLLKNLYDPAVAEQMGFNVENFTAMFIPNTYEVYWTTDATSLMQRMKSEYDRFWNEARRKKAEEMGLTPVEVSTLASIVEEEAT